MFAARPLVSVLILAYNHERYIQQAIESILSQITDFPIEVVVAEDCSTNETFAYASGLPTFIPDSWTCRDQRHKCRHDEKLAARHRWLSR